MITPAKCHPSRAVKGGGLCASCYGREYRKQNAKALRRTARAYREANKDRIRARDRLRPARPGYTAAWCRKNPVRARAMRRRAWIRQRAARYGLTVEQVRALYRKQRNACAICHERRPLAIDHDHTTGRVRGLLCHLCNKALGGFRDDPKLLTQARRYLRARAC